MSLSDAKDVGKNYPPGQIGIAPLIISTARKRAATCEKAMLHERKPTTVRPVVGFLSFYSTEIHHT